MRRGEQNTGHQKFDQKSGVGFAVTDRAGFAIARRGCGVQLQPIVALLVREPLVQQDAQGDEQRADDVLDPIHHQRRGRIPPADGEAGYRHGIDKDGSPNFGGKSWFL